MKIKTRLQITATIAILLALSIGSFIFFVNQRLSGVIEENRKADEIVRGVFELNILTSDYLLHRNERIIDQWWSKYDTISRMLIEVEESDDPEEQARIDVLRENHKSIATTFFQLVTVLGRVPDEKRSTSSIELENRLVSQLTTRSQTMVTSVSMLARENRQELADRQQQLSLFVLAAIFILAATIVASSFLTIRGVLRPLLKLTETADSIAEGTLHQLVEIKSQDEVGQLANSFNIMTSKLKKSYEGLEEKVKHRTKELSESNKKLKSLDVAKTEFLSSASHELKSPLVPVYGYLQMLNGGELGKLTKEQKEVIKVCYRNVSNLTLLINDMLDLSKIELNKISLKKEKLDVVKLATEIKENFKIMAEEKYVELRIVAPESLVVFADKLRINQVLSNLVKNALHYASGTKEKTKKAIIAITDGETVIRVNVTDEGPGISRKDQANLFNKFYRIKKSESSSSGGSGLGLSISKALIHLHGGILTVKSEVGKGSEFSFTIPRGGGREVDKPREEGKKIPPKQVHNKEKNKTFQKPVTKPLDKTLSKNDKTSVVKSISIEKKPVVNTSVKRMKKEVKNNGKINTNRGR